MTILKVYAVRYNSDMHIPDTPQALAARIATQALKAAGFEAYVVGGAVRDLLLGQTPKDFDLATDATPEQIQALPEFKHAFYKDTAQAYGITRVRLDVADKSQNISRLIELEIATYREDIHAHRGRTQTEVAFSTLEADLQRRDFTVNALALDITQGAVIDLTGGQADINDRQLRFIGPAATRIKEDPVRVLRAVRLKNQLGFDYEDSTKAALKDHAQTAARSIAIERIKVEVTHMLMSPARIDAIRDLDDFKLLEIILPEIAAMKGVTQPPHLHAEGDVYRHTLLALGYLPEIVSPRLAWATLLHDVAKPVTWRAATNSTERIRFDGHHRVGSEMADHILKRLQFKPRFRREVAWMVHYHLAIDDLPDMRPRKADAFMHHPAFADLLELHKADAQAAWSIRPDDSIDRDPADFSQLDRLWSDYQQRRTQHPPSLKTDLGIDGHWLKREFQLTDGVLIGAVLTELEEAYLQHTISTMAEAHDLAARLVAQHR